MDSKTANDIANKSQISKINEIIETAAHKGQYSTRVEFIEKPSIIYEHFAELGFMTTWSRTGCKFALIISWGGFNEILLDTDETNYDEVSHIDSIYPKKRRQLR